MSYIKVVVKRPWRHPLVFDEVKPKVFIDEEYKVVSQTALPYCYMEYSAEELKKKISNGGREIKGMKHCYALLAFITLLVISVTRHCYCYALLVYKISTIFMCSLLGCI